MLRSETNWIWDFWLADDGTDFHLFYLHAPRALGDPDERHWNVRVGHAVSGDLRNWTQLGDALGPGEPGAVDDRATWTGSVVRGADGMWTMFYTAASSVEHGLVQRIASARSPDLHTWTKDNAAIIEADPRWYEQLPSGQWFDEAWRDPWVYPDSRGNGWHMLITARASRGDADDRGVIGHATSPDLRSWNVTAPLSQPGSGFGHLEVPQVATIEGRTVLLFSCLSKHLSRGRRTTGQEGGIWTAPISPSPVTSGPEDFDVAAAAPLTDETLYSGRLITDRTGQWVLLAFHNISGEGFIGEISDPILVRWSDTFPPRLVTHTQQRQVA